MSAERCRVAVVGAGPSGLAVATELARSGVGRIIVIEREAEAGGIPRHCGHSPFGMREYRRVLSGPAYTRRLVADACRQGVEIRTCTSVVRLGNGGCLTLSSAAGEQQLEADRVVLCTGNRETPRAARLVSGTRPLGVLTTGALQSMVYLKRRIPFRHPVIVGSELVSFSAFLTCRHAGIRPRAMIDHHPRAAAWPFATLLPKLFGAEVLLDSRLQSIDGRARVEAVTLLDASGRSRRVDCDGVVFSGDFVAESTLVRASHLALDPASGGPLIDQFGRCSDSRVFSCGNLIHPVDTAGWCWAEGRRTATAVRLSLEGGLERYNQVTPITSHDDRIRYFTPQRIAISEADDATVEDWPHRELQLRFHDRVHGQLSLGDDRGMQQCRRVRCRRGDRIVMALPPIGRISESSELRLDFSGMGGSR